MLFIIYRSHTDATFIANQSRCSLSAVFIESTWILCIVAEHRKFSANAPPTPLSKILFVRLVAFTGTAKTFFKRLWTADETS